MEDKQNRAPINKKSTFREYAEAFAIAILLALFIRTFIIQAFKIPSGSMKPTLLIGDHLLVNKFIYGIRIPFFDKYIIHFKKPDRGDVIVFKWPKDESKDFIKRVIGIEGDNIELRKDILYINGKKIKKEYIGEYNADAVEYLEFIGERKHSLLDIPSQHTDYGPKIVPENFVFVMGDNRDNSQDSRYWGYVPLNKIKGKALIIYWSWAKLEKISEYDKIILLCTVNIL